MQRHGWVLLFHECIVEQLQKLHAATERAQRSDPEGFRHNANVKLFRTLSQLILDTIPSDPERDEYRQGNTLGPEHRHWRRAKIGRRFRLFFRYDPRTKTIILAWVNDEQTLRSADSKSDPYAVFERMLKRGYPPDAWVKLLAASRSDWSVAALPGLGRKLQRLRLPPQRHYLRRHGQIPGLPFGMRPGPGKASRRQQCQTPRRPRIPH